MLCIFNGHKFSVDAGTFFEIIVSSETWSSYRRLSQLREHSDQSRYMLISIIILFISDNKITLLLIYKQVIV